MSRLPGRVWAVWVVAVVWVAVGRPVFAEALFVGAAVGQGNVSADLLSPFDQHHTAFSIVAGIRANAYAGAELEYLGHPHRSVTVGNSVIDDGDVSQRGYAAYGVAYLPWRSLDLFAKGWGSVTASLVCFAC